MTGLSRRRSLCSRNVCAYTRLTLWNLHGKEDLRASARDKSRRKGSSDPPEEQLVRAWATASWRTYWRTRKRYLANRRFLTELQNRPNRRSPSVGRFDSYAAPLVSRMRNRSAVASDRAGLGDPA